MTERLVVPHHVAVIPDGNRRWAKENNSSTIEGHRLGAARIISNARFGFTELAIPTQTYWLCSPENLTREPEEVAGLMTVFRGIFTDPAMEEFIERGVRLRFLGDLAPLPTDLIEMTNVLANRSRNNMDGTIAFGLNYDGRSDLVRAYNRMFEAGIRKADEQTIAAHLDTGGMPDPDLIIRTSFNNPKDDNDRKREDETTVRMSGFMSWQGAKSEWYFTKTRWPDFEDEEYRHAITIFNASERRFGK